MFDENRLPTLRTSRLLLRPWREEDLAPFAALNADEEVMRHFPSTLSREQSDGLVDKLRGHFREHGFGPWAVEVRGGAPFIGFVGVFNVPFEAPFTPAVEIGWRLSRSAWGRGYASEAAEASLRFGFGALGLDEIVSMTVPANLASRRVMEKIGMRRDEEGDFLHPRVPEGHPLKPHVLYRRSRRGWARGEVG